MILSRRSFLAGTSGYLFSAGMLKAGAGYEPRRGSKERKAILDALRPAIEAQLRGPVEFVIDRMRVEGSWAFVVADPQRPGGRPINIYDTAFANDADFMGSLTVYALLLFENGRWNLLDHAVGPTDVFYEIWPERFGAPRGILGLR